MVVITEDQFVDSIIQQSPEWGWTTEVHYNYYGDRGVVDLVGELGTKPTESELERVMERTGQPRRIAERHAGTKKLEIYEVKSAQAVEKASGANEILRQFNRHKEYFFKGSDYDESQYFNVDFFLVFILGETTFSHVMRFYNIYCNAAGDLDTHMDFRHPHSPRRRVLIDNLEPDATFDDLVDEYAVQSLFERDC